MNLEEKNMPIFVFSGIALDGKSRYQRLDTNEILEGRVKILLPHVLVFVNYSGEKTIRMESTEPEADGLAFIKTPEEGKSYLCNYCQIESKKEENEKNRVIGGFVITN